MSRKKEFEEVFEGLISGSDMFACFKLEISKI